MSGITAPWAGEPVELVPPDIEPYRNDGGPWPFITTFDAPAPGPHVAITAIVHGNEPCGAIALDWLLRRDVRPRCGRLSLAFLNVEAYRRFDPSEPTASRWVEEDFNRVWDEATLDGPRRSVELARAREIRPWVDSVDTLLDIHSMQHATEALTLAGTHPKGMALAAAVGVPSLIVADQGHAAGRRLRDYGAFGEPAGARAAILVECGQHWAKTTADVAIESAVRFLRVTGTVDPDWQADAFASAPPPARCVEVTDAVTIASRDFRFTEPFKGLEVIAKAGTVIALDGETEVTTPYDDCVLIMPSRRLAPGQTAVRLGRYVGR